MNTVVQKFAVGQQVVVIEPYHNYYDYKVSKVTPTGRVTVVNSGGVEIKFDSAGKEIGDVYSRRRISNDVDGYQKKDRIKKQVIAAASKVNSVNVKIDYPGYATKEKLQYHIDTLARLLDDAKHAVSQIED